MDSFRGQWTALDGFIQEQLHVIRMHCHQVNGQTEEKPEEELHETTNNTFLPQSNVASDEADSYSLNGLTEDDGGVEALELNDDPFLSRSDIESSDNQEDDEMTERSSLISDIKRRIEELGNSLDVDETDSDSSNDLTESEPEEPQETEDNTSLSRLDVGTHKDDETDADPQNDLTESAAKDEWFQAVGNSSPIDAVSHDIETAGKLYEKGQNAQSAKTIEIGTDLTESYQDINNWRTVESNKTVLDLSGDLSTGIMFGLGHHIEDLFKCEPNQQNSNGLA